LIISYGWQWLFAINIPVAILVVILSFLVLPETSRTDGKHFDWPGMLTLAGALAGLTYAINHINTEELLASISSLEVWPFLVLFLLFIIIFWKMEERAQDPIIRINLFKNLQITLVSLISIFSGLNEAGLIFIPAFAIVALGFNNAMASLMLLPVVVAMAIGAPTIGRILDKIGSKI